MTVYDLHLESGPRHRKTMVHVLDLLGCIANGPTTEDALDATPAAIRAYRRFLQRHGETIDLESPIETRIVEHVTEGAWLGNGSPYIVFGPDFDAITDEEIGTYLARCGNICEELATWAESRTDAELDAPDVGGGRTARAILLHVLGAKGAALSAALSGALGFSRLHSRAVRNEIALAAALREAVTMATDRVHATTPEQRAAVRELNNQSYTLRKALRGMLEHDWEHLAELARRPGGPAL